MWWKVLALKCIGLLYNLSQCTEYHIRQREYGAIGQLLGAHIHHFNGGAQCSQSIRRPLHHFLTLVTSMRPRRHRLNGHRLPQRLHIFVLVGRDVTIQINCNHDNNIPINCIVNHWNIANTQKVEILVSNMKKMRHLIKFRNNPIELLPLFLFFIMKIRWISCFKKYRIIGSCLLVFLSKISKKSWFLTKFGNFLKEYWKSNYFAGKELYLFPYYIEYKLYLFVNFVWIL